MNEIDRNNQIVKLTDLHVPTIKQNVPVTDDEDLLLNQYNLEILPLETWDNINSLAMSKENEANQPIEVCLLANLILIPIEMIINSRYIFYHLRLM